MWHIAKVNYDSKLKDIYDKYDVITKIKNCV